MRVIAVLALLLAVAACGGEEAETTAPVKTATAAAPVAGTTLDGDPVSLDDFRGKPVFVNVWSSW